jgi:hypothetical protein
MNFPLRNFPIRFYCINILPTNSLVEKIVILLLESQTLLSFRAEQLIKSTAKLVFFKFLALKTRRGMYIAIT